MWTPECSKYLLKSWLLYNSGAAIIRSKKMIGSKYLPYGTMAPMNAPLNENWQVIIESRWQPHKRRAGVLFSIFRSIWRVTIAVLLSAGPNFLIWGKKTTPGRLRKEWSRHRPPRWERQHSETMKNNVPNDAASRIVRVIFTACFQAPLFLQHQPREPHTGQEFDSDLQHVDYWKQDLKAIPIIRKELFIDKSTIFDYTRKYTSESRNRKLIWNTTVW